MNKKASILDGMLILVLVLVFFLIFVSSKVVWEGVTESGQLQGNYSETAKIIQRYDDRIIPMFDNWFLFAIIAGYMGVFILAFFIRGTPAFLPIMLIIICISEVLAVFVSNAHDYIVTHNSLIANAAADWTKMTFLIENLPLINLVLMVGLIIVMLSMGETL